MHEMTGRLLAVGDIHGYRDKLERLMAAVAPTPDDTVVFIGDYIDRGPDSFGVIDYLRSFGDRFPGTTTIFLRGNHEQLLLDFLVDYHAAPGRPLLPAVLAGHRRMREISHLAASDLGASDWNNFMLNGGQQTVASYHRQQESGDAKGDAAAMFRVFPPEHIAFIAATRLWHEEEVTWHTAAGPQSATFLFVHAGVRSGVPLERQDPMDLLWIRDSFLRSNRTFAGRIVVHGHSPNASVPTRHTRRICVDSGVCSSGPVNPFSRRTWGKLTCCDVLTREIWQA